MVSDIVSEAQIVHGKLPTRSDKFNLPFWPAPPRETLDIAGFLVVGARGIEPLTPTMSR